MHGQRQDVFIPEIPEFALGIAKGHAAKSCAHYDDGVETGFLFGRFCRIGFHVTREGAKRPPNPLPFLGILLPKFVRKGKRINKLGVS
jgi:hypothetical protein